MGTGANRLRSKWAQEQTGSVANGHWNKEAQEQIDAQEQIGTRATRHRSK